MSGTCYHPKQVHVHISRAEVNTVVSRSNFWGSPNVCKRLCNRRRVSGIRVVVVGGGVSRLTSSSQTQPGPSIANPSTGSSGSTWFAALTNYIPLTENVPASTSIHTHTHTHKCWTEEVSERNMSLAVKGQGAGSSWGAAGTARLNVPLTQNGCYVSKPAHQGLSQPLTISDIAGSFTKKNSPSPSRRK